MTFIHFTIAARIDAEASTIRCKSFAEKTEYDGKGQRVRSQSVRRNETASVSRQRLDRQHKVIANSIESVSN